MGLARDGSIGVLTMRWRRVELEGVLYVEEQWGGAPGPILFGPIPDAAACTALIRERAASTKAAYEAGRAELLARFPNAKRHDRKVLEDDDVEANPQSGGLPAQAAGERPAAEGTSSGGP